MKKMILYVLILVVLYCSCTKQNSKVEPLAPTREQRIEAALNTENPNRVLIATKLLLTTEQQKSYYLKELIVTDSATNKKTFAYVMLSKTESSLVKSLKTATLAMAPPDCGSVTPGWILKNDGCWYAGNTWTGCNGQSIFVEYSNPYGDNIVGNEPRCMSDGEFDTWV